MAISLKELQAALTQVFGDKLTDNRLTCHEVTIEVMPNHLLDVAKQLRDLPQFQFTQLIDLCVVDYLEYGQAEWQTESATTCGFDRAVARQQKIQVKENHHPERFAVVIHLLSIELNIRLRVKIYIAESSMLIPSVNDIWNAASWFEREAFDLFGILFQGHPDLRRILTDYGFIGHPFRKDFPLSGHVEMRYDATLQRVVYEPVSIKPRTLVPRIVRDDNRYDDTSNDQRSQQ